MKVDIWCGHDLVMFHPIEQTTISHTPYLNPIFNIELLFKMIWHRCLYHGEAYTIPVDITFQIWTQDWYEGPGFTGHNWKTVISKD